VPGRTARSAVARARRHVSGLRRAGGSFLRRAHRRRCCVPPARGAQDAAAALGARSRRSGQAQLMVKVSVPPQQCEAVDSPREFAMLMRANSLVSCPRGTPPRRPPRPSSPPVGIRCRPASTPGRPRCARSSVHPVRGSEARAGLGSQRPSPALRAARSRVPAQLVPRARARARARAASRRREPESPRRPSCRKAPRPLHL